MPLTRRLAGLLNDMISCLLLLAQINTARLVEHRTPLSPTRELVIAAQAKADDMEKNHYFSHGLSSYHLSSYLLGENLAKNFYDNESVLHAWLASPTHKANILDKDFTKTGIAISKSGQYVVELFGN